MGPLPAASRTRSRSQRRTGSAWVRRVRRAAERAGRPLRDRREEVGPNSSTASLLVRTVSTASSERSISASVGRAREVVEPWLRGGALVIADDTDLFPAVLADYLSHVRGAGYRSQPLPLGDGLELSCRT